MGISDSLEWQRVFLGIISGAIVMAISVVGFLIVGAYNELKIHGEVEKHASKMDKLAKDMDQVMAAGAQFESIFDLMKPFKKHLLQSAFDLQSRLTNQLGTNFLNDFATRRTGARDKDYAIDSTTYFFAEFLAWMEVIRRQVVFVTGSEYAESLNSLLDCIRFQLTGESPFQGCPPQSLKGKIKKNNDMFDVHSHILQLYIVDIRSIGNAMLHVMDDLVQPIPVDKFLRNMHDDAFRLILEPLSKSIKELAMLDAKSAPKRRLAILQVLLCKLIDILDSAVPWDCGPKFDSNEEPRYIMRDPRLCPRVMDLSHAQKSYLQSLPFFDDDPNLSFPGFREDLASKMQSERDLLLWPGACPPQEPRLRDEGYKKIWLHTQAIAAREAGKAAAASAKSFRTASFTAGQALQRHEARLKALADAAAASAAAAAAAAGGAGAAKPERKSKITFSGTDDDDESIARPSKMPTYGRLTPSQLRAQTTAEAVADEPRGLPWTQYSLEMVSEVANVIDVRLAPERPSVMLVCLSGNAPTVSASVNAIAKALPRAPVRWKTVEPVAEPEGGASAAGGAAGGGFGRPALNIDVPASSSGSVVGGPPTRSWESVMGKLPGQALLSLLQETRNKRLAAASATGGADPTLAGGSRPSTSTMGGPGTAPAAAASAPGAASAAPSNPVKRSPFGGKGLTASALVAAAKKMAQEQEQVAAEPPGTPNGSSSRLAAKAGATDAGKLPSSRPEDPSSQELDIPTLQDAETKSPKMPTSTFSQRLLAQPPQPGKPVKPLIGLQQHIRSPLKTLGSGAGGPMGVGGGGLGSHSAAVSAAGAAAEGGGEVAVGPKVQLYIEVENPTGVAWDAATLDLLDEIPNISGLRISPQRSSLIVCTVCDTLYVARAAANSIARLLPRAPVMWRTATEADRLAQVASIAATLSSSAIGGRSGGAGAHSHHISHHVSHLSHHTPVHSMSHTQMFRAGAQMVLPGSVAK